MHVIRGDELDTVSLQLAHVTWFVSIKYSGGLNIGVYEGDDLRLVGTRTILLVKLDPSFLRHEIEKTLEKQIVALLDPTADRFHHTAVGESPKNRLRRRRSTFAVAKAQ